MAASRQDDRRLQVCLWCGSNFASLVEWHVVDEHHWWVLLRCGECGVWCAETVSNSAAKALDRELDRTTLSIMRELARIDRERMEEQAQAFVGALERDLIDAADFEPPGLRLSRASAHDAQP
jgi:hypothetical protein